MKFISYCPRYDRKKLPAIVDRLYKERTKGKARIRWNKVVENVWQELGGNIFT